VDISMVAGHIWHVTIPPNGNWHYPCQPASLLGPGHIADFVGLEYRPLAVTIGSTGRVVGGYRIYPDSYIPVAEAISVDSSKLMHEYFGEQIPSDLMYLWWDDELPLSSFSDPLFQMIEARSQYYPLLVVGPDYRKCLVVDQNKHVRCVVISTYDTYDQFVNHGASMWYLVDPISIELSICGTIISPKNNDMTATLLLAVLNSLSPENSSLPTINIRYVRDLTDDSAN
jgi:hypothetical protein